MSSILPSFAPCCPEEFCSDPITVSVPGPPGEQGEQGEAATGSMVGWFVKDNLDDALLIPAGATNQFLVMLGGAAANDGFGGLFNWDNTSVAVHDYSYTGGSVITPSGWGGVGRWLRWM